MKRRLFARRTCAKFHVPRSTIDRMPSPSMEDAVTGWYSTVFKRCAMHAICQTCLCLERVRLLFMHRRPAKVSRMVAEARQKAVPVTSARVTGALARHMIEISLHKQLPHVAGMHWPRNSYVSLCCPSIPLFTSPPPCSL